MYMYKYITLWVCVVDYSHQFPDVVNGPVILLTKLFHTLKTERK